MKSAIALLFTAYFLVVAWDGLGAPFSADDMLAIYTYWHPPPLRVLTSQFMLWRGYFRPMGAMTLEEIMKADAVYSWEDRRLVRFGEGHLAVPVPPGRYDDLGLHIRYRSDWSHDLQFASAANHSLSYSDEPNASFQFAFRGSAVTWVYTKAANRGIAEAFVDGRSVGQVDLYSPRTVWQSRTVFGSLSAGKHLLEVKVLNRKNPLSSGTYVDLDELIVQ